MKDCMLNRHIVFIDDTLYPCLFNHMNLKYLQEVYPSFSTVLNDYRNVCTACSYENLYYTCKNDVAYISIDRTFSKSDIEKILLWLHDNGFHDLNFISMNTSTDSYNSLKMFMEFNLKEYSIASVTLSLNKFPEHIIEYLGVNISLVYNVVAVYSNVDDIIDLDDECVRTSIYELIVIGNLKHISIKFIACKDNLNRILDAYAKAKKNTVYSVIDFTVSPASFIYGMHSDMFLDSATQNEICNLLYMVQRAEYDSKINTSYSLI